MIFEERINLRIRTQELIEMWGFVEKGKYQDLSTFIRVSIFKELQRLKQLEEKEKADTQRQKEEVKT